ncbi:MAG: hypothetical protein PHV39_08480 [Methanomicrobium sp.]|nr:hypothetical protein [Methanomicrobium sp.]
MDFKTVREFHWLTKTVILLTAFVFVLMLTAIATALLGMSDISSGLGMILLSSLSILMQLFPIILIVIVLCIIGAHIKAWIEKYLDSMLAKMDALVERKDINDKSDVRLTAMNDKIEEIERKVDNIADILKNVSE